MTIYLVSTSQHNILVFPNNIRLDQLLKMESIDKHLEQDRVDLEDAKSKGQDKKIRHLTDEINSLEEYKANHPEEKTDPNSLELYCDANPDKPECLVYDD